MVRNTRLVCLVNREEYEEALKNANSKGFFNFSNFIRSRILETDLLEQSISEINRNVKENNRNIKKILELLENMK